MKTLQEDCPDLMFQHLHHHAVLPQCPGLPPSQSVQLPFDDDENNFDDDENNFDDDEDNFDDDEDKVLDNSVSEK